MSRDAITPTRTNVPVRPHHRHGPPEPARRDVLAEMQLDVAEVPRRQLALRGLEIGAWQAEAEAALKFVVRAAGQHQPAARARMSPPTDARTPAASTSSAVTRAPARSSAPAAIRAIGQRAVESGRSITVASGEAWSSRRDAARRQEPGRRQRVEGRRLGQAELVEALGRETPVQCTGSPMRACSSQTSVRTPRPARRAAMKSPPGPPPTMRTSIGIMRRSIISGVLRLSRCGRAFPRRRSGDPERQHDQASDRARSSARRRYSRSRRNLLAREMSRGA